MQFLRPPPRLGFPSVVGSRLRRVVPLRVFDVTVSLAFATIVRDVNHTAGSVNIEARRCGQIAAKRTTAICMHAVIDYVIVPEEEELLGNCIFVPWAPLPFARCLLAAFESLSAPALQLGRDRRFPP